MALSTNLARNLLLRACVLPSRKVTTGALHRCRQSAQTELGRRSLTLTCRCALSTSHFPLSQKHSPGVGWQNFSTSPAIQYADAEEESDTLQKVAARAAEPEVGRLFAVVHFSGTQRKVTTDDVVAMTTHIDADVGDVIRLNKVLLVGGADFTVAGRPVLSPNVVRVEGQVIEKTLEQTKIVYNYTARKGNSRMKLHKGLITMLRITKIELLPLQ